MNSTILKKLNKEKKPLVLAIFLLGGLLAAETWVLSVRAASGLGGPAESLPAKLHIMVDDLGSLESRNMRVSEVEDVLRLNLLF